jgi:predicted nucleotidyltransferase
MVFPILDTREYLWIRTTMDDATLLHIPCEVLADFCRRYQVRELALFGSMLRQEHRPDSDVDLLVSFAPAARVTFLTLARMQRELEGLLGRKVDLVPKEGLKPIIREHILATARVLYAA